MNGKRNGSGRAPIDSRGRVARRQSRVVTASAGNVSTQGDMEHESTALLLAARLRGVSDNAPKGWVVDRNGLAILLVRVDAKLTCDAE